MEDQKMANITDEERKNSWETPPEPIPSQIKETVTTDIVVVGAGEAGLVAALSATEADAKVIILEKFTTSRYGGNYNAALGSKFMKKLGIEFDKDQAVLEFMRWHDSRPDQKLIRMWADHSGEVMDWMLAMTEAAGIETKIHMWPTPPEWNPAREFYPDYPYSHSIGYKNGDNNKPLIDCLKANLLDKGVEIRYSTSGVQLIRKDKQVTGLIAKNKDGNYIQFNANKAVILCTGDFGNDSEMMKEYCTASIGKLSSTSNIYTGFMAPEEQPKEKLNVGDGHKMAMWVGAQMEERNIGTMSGLFGPSINFASFLTINANGERFENEDTSYFLVPNAVMRQPGGIVWQILDAKYPEDFQKMGEWGMFATRTISEEQQKGIDTGSVKADTIEELAHKIKVPVKALKATVTRRNELAHAGQDLDFGLLPERLTTVEKPPFYAIQIVPMFAVTVGGIIVNDKLQAVDVDGKIIPGLYLAGNTVGKRFGEHFNNPIPGMSNGFACTHGYFAGKNAAADRK